MKKLNGKNNLFSAKNIFKQIKSIASTALIVLFVTSAIVEGSLVPTGSMEKTILIGDRLLVNKFLFGASTPRYIPFTDITLPYVSLPAMREPEKNDIIVFRYPGDKNQLEDDAYEYWVKRCIGAPGDVVEIINKVVFVNGKEFPIPPNIQYINNKIKPAGIPNPDIFPYGAKWNEDNYGPLTAPGKGDVIELTLSNFEQWRMIINREFGRNAAEIHNGKIFIDGKNTSSYTLKEDYYFMMGDNRDNSLDSRFWGFVPRKNIVGTPIAVFWSWDSDIPLYDLPRLIGSIRLNRIAKLIK